MSEKFLQKNDVINLEKGTRVYAKIPEKFVFENRRASNNLTKTEITIGEVYNNKVNINKIMERILERIKDSFMYEIGMNINQQKAEDFITSSLNSYKFETFDTSMFIGEYCVIETSMTGGSYAQGYDYYPDGYMVRCKKLKDGLVDENGIEVSFYQSGSFTVVIKPDEIQAIRQISQKYFGFWFLELRDGETIDFHPSTDSKNSPLGTVRGFDQGDNWEIQDFVVPDEIIEKYEFKESGKKYPTVLIPKDLVKRTFFVPVEINK